MKKSNHKEIQSFLETGVSGAYEFSEPSISKTKIGKMFPYFNDVEITVDNEGSKISREMYIG